MTTMKVEELDSITITRPDDMHLHVRADKAMEDVVPYSARQFGRAIIMPNLKPPITKAAQAWTYYEEIRAVAKRHGSYFEPLMTLYLTDSTTVADINDAKASGLVHAIKYYPAGATTNSDDGVTDIEKVSGQLERMEEIGIPLLVHGEVTDPTVDIFNREQVFIERVLIPSVVEKFPGLKIVLEHITTAFGATYVASAGKNIAATITAHHLLCNRNHLLVGGIKPHLYCLPILKKESDRVALVRAATSGNPKFFLGTDSAPHPKNGLPEKAKETACGCAGCFTAPHALELYAEAFDSVGEISKLEGFASHFGADFYGLPRNIGTVTLVREESDIPTMLNFGDGVVVPFCAGETMQWKMKRNRSS